MRTPPTTYSWSRFGAPEYTDRLDESMSWKETCCIGHWSFLWQHRFSGPDAIKLLSDTSVNSFDVFRDDDYVMHGRGGFWVNYQLGRGRYDAEATRDDWFIIQVSGPNAVRVLDRLHADKELRETKDSHVAPLRIAGHDIWALRQGMAGEIGFELQGPREHGDAVHAAVMDAGQEFGIRRLGVRVTMINHLEACYPTIGTDYMPAIFDEDMAEYLEIFRSSMPAYAHPAYIAGSYDGQEISEYYRSPVELGWARNIKLDHDFLGREALEKEKAEPRRAIRTRSRTSSRRCCGPASTTPSSTCRVTSVASCGRTRSPAGADVVGEATSRGYSYYFRKMLSIATIDVEHAELGNELTVHWGEPDNLQKPIRTRVAGPPYIQDRSRGELPSA